MDACAFVAIDTSPGAPDAELSEVNPIVRRHERMSIGSDNRPNPQRAWEALSARPALLLPRRRPNAQSAPSAELAEERLHLAFVEGPQRLGADVPRSGHLQQRRCDGRVIGSVDDGNEIVVA